MHQSSNFQPSIRSPKGPRRMPITRAQRRAVAYVRVSSEEQVEGYSLAAQERAVRAYCEAHGWDLLTIYPDEGKSAWTDDIAKRPAFARMLADAEAGAFDVLIVHKLDRFARNVMVALETLHQLEANDVGFVSLSESMDFASPIGKVTLTMLASFAQYYSDNLSAETKKGKAERKRQGMYNGVIPVRHGEGTGRYSGGASGESGRSAAGLRARCRGNLRPGGGASAQRGGIPDHRQPGSQPLHQGHGAADAAESVLPGRTADR